MIYLYVKQCNHCGKKYFGKTTNADPFKYKGSGKYWTRHLNSNKSGFTTLDVYTFDDQKDATKFALEYSAQHNIKESKEWFNLRFENGLDGNPKGNIPANKGKTSKLKGLSYEDIYGVEEAIRLKSLRSKSNKSRGPRSNSTRDAISNTRKERIRDGTIKIVAPPIRPENLAKANAKIKCEHCDKIGSYANMKRWHFDKCKFKT